ncbi:MAG: hypothetical protein IPL61_22875 [Myxococcales bacterium]|nr:hypothetical protein [Myxococcales bacterium]
MDTVQVPVPVQALVQPVNVEAPDGVAVSTTEVLGCTGRAAAPELMPAGAEVTVPVLVPLVVTVRGVGVGRSWR